MVNMSYARPDGKLIPDAMREDIEHIIMTDGINAPWNKLLMEEVRYVPHFEFPADHPDNPTPRKASASTLEYEWQKYTWQLEKVCPNCLQEPPGEIYAYTGNEGRYVHFWDNRERSPIRRSLRSYPCPVCGDGVAHTTLLMFSGLAEDERRLSYKDVYWDYEDKAEDGTTVNRKELESAVRFILYHMTNKEGGDPHKAYGMYTFVGKYGCGKSFLAQYLTAALCRARVRAEYWTIPRIVEQIREADPFVTPSVIGRLQGLPVLVIDQLDWLTQMTGKGNLSLPAEHIRNMIDHRYSHRGLVTLVTTNWKWWNEKGGALDSAYDRLRGGVVATTQLESVRHVLGEMKKAEIMSKQHEIKDYVS